MTGHYFLIKDGSSDTYKDLLNSQNKNCVNTSAFSLMIFLVYESPEWLNLCNPDLKFLVKYLIVIYCQMLTGCPCYFL